VGLRYLPHALIAAMLVAFVAHARAQPDPSLGAGVIHIGDRREHTLESRPYSETKRIIDGLRAQRAAAAAPEEQAVADVRLADLFAARQMFPEARAEIEDARRLAPAEPEVLWRLAVIERHLGHAPEAQAALAEALRLAPGDPHVLKAADFVRAP
jgi:Flp pilus assembly protein TadD